MVAWLLKHGHNETAREVLAKIGPYVSQLRVLSGPSHLPAILRFAGFRGGCGLSTIGRLRNIKPNAQILAQKEAIEIWTPLYDRVVALFLETIEKEPAKLAAGPPAGWHERARLLLNEVDDAARTASHSRKHTRKKENFAQLISFLRKWVDPRRDRDDKEVKRVRELLGVYVSKRGVPGSQPVAPCANGNPSNARGQHSMRSRASSSTGSGNIHRRPALRTLRRWSNPWTTRKRRCRRQSYEKSCAASLEDVDVLIERGVITSAEMLAPCCRKSHRPCAPPALAIRSSGHFMGEIYRAFRRRRSLLLLDLQSQVRIEELPWVRAIEGIRRRKPVDNGGGAANTRRARDSHG